MGRGQTQRAAIVSSAVLIPLFVAACGGGGGGGSSSSLSGTSVRNHAAAAALKAPLSKVAYERKMQILGRTLANELNEIGEQADGTPSQDAAAITTAIPKLRDAARKLAEIVPPKPIREEHEHLRKAVLEFASELQGPIASLKTGDLNGLGDIYALPGARDMEIASAKIEKMGYKIVASR